MGLNPIKAIFPRHHIVGHPRRINPFVEHHNFIDYPVEIAFPIHISPERACTVFRPRRCPIIRPPCPVDIDTPLLIPNMHPGIERDRGGQRHSARTDHIKVEVAIFIDINIGRPLFFAFGIENIGDRTRIGVFIDIQPEEKRPFGRAICATRCQARNKGDIVIPIKFQAGPHRCNRGLIGRAGRPPFVTIHITIYVVSVIKCGPTLILIKSEIEAGLRQHRFNRFTGRIDKAIGIHRRRGVG